MFIASYIGGNLRGHKFITLDGCRFLKKRKLMKVSQQNIKRRARLTVTEPFCKLIVDLVEDAFSVSVSVQCERGDMGSLVLCSPTDCFSEVAAGVGPGFGMICLYCFCV